MPLSEEERVKLEVERSIGEDWERVWVSKLGPFFEKKQQELFEAFKDTPTSDTDALLTIKLQSNALESLAAEFQHHIETGKLARTTLQEEENNE